VRLVEGRCVYICDFNNKYQTFAVNITVRLIKHYTNSIKHIQYRSIRVMCEILLIVF